MSQLKSDNIMEDLKQSETSPRYLEDDCITYVITRTGKQEPLDQSKITKRLLMLIDRKPKIKHVNPYELTKDVSIKLTNGVTTYQIDEYVAEAAASKSISDPAYMQIASRLVVDNHQRATGRSFLDKMKQAYLRKDDNGIISPLLSEEFYKYVEDHQETIEHLIDYSRDFRCDYFGMRTFQDSYGLKINGKTIERPQDLYMRTAVAIHMNTQYTYNDDGVIHDIEGEIALIKTVYDKYSFKQITQASPTYFNAGTIYPQCASCFLMGTEDSREGIMKTADDCSNASKGSGGIGMHINNWRSNGMLIRKTNGRSNGIVPFLRIYNSTMMAFNQGGGKGKGKRNGSLAIYLMPHHPDVMAFLRLKLPHGAEEERARELFYAMWIPDLFMERVDKDEMWSLFDPDQVGDLSDYSGAEYNKRYLLLEQQKKYRSQISARTIWKAIFTANKETGVPYICFSDTVNEHNMQSNIGVIKSSNLCVVGDTKILVKQHKSICQIPINILSNILNNRHEIWNGKEWSMATFAHTGQHEVMEVGFSNGKKLTCTLYHKFAIQLKKSDSYPTHLIKEAKDLQLGDKIIKYSYPLQCKSSIRKLPYPKDYQYHHDEVLQMKTQSNVSITSIKKLNEVADTYCFNEPLQHMGIFNGIITMQCSEIMQYSDSKQTAVCNLGSVSISSCVHDSYTKEELALSEDQRRVLDDTFPKNPHFDFEELLDNVKILTVNLNKIIEKNLYPTKETSVSNVRHRPIGIGMQGLADTYIKLRYAFESPEAVELNKKIVEVMYYGSTSQSSKLAKNKYLQHVAECKHTGKTTVIEYLPDYTTKETTYNCWQDIRKNVGAYGSMYWNGGSPLANGKFHWELYNATDLSTNPKLDWASLKEHINIFGVRNSLTIALMPTATTSQFLGNNECFEPYTSNMYKRKTLAGEFIIINKYLIHDLYRLNIWNENIKNYLLLCNGSIQNIHGIPADLKQLYKTAWEIDQMHLIQQAIDRQPFVDQAQSLNLYVEDLSLAVFNKLMFKAWKGKLKTGKYYLHTRPGAMPQAFTIDPEKQKDILNILEKDHARSIPDEKITICDSCSA